MILIVKCILQNSNIIYDDDSQIVLEQSSIARFEFWHQ